jgi:hypothetical protein
MIKRHGQVLEMLVKPVANPFFDFSRQAEKTVPPDISEGRHGQCDGHDHAPKPKEHRGRGLSEGQGVDGPLDDHGDQELEKIDGQKTEKTGDQNPAVPNKILLERKKIVERFPHSTSPSKREGILELEMPCQHLTTFQPEPRVNRDQLC